jgi:hypothetical protein
MKVSAFVLSVCCPGAGLYLAGVLIATVGSRGAAKGRGD